MKRLLLLLLASSLHAAEPDYPPGEDSQPHDGVPKGELLKFTVSNSKAFPGTTREVTVYVPAQYDGSQPACVYVNQDGLQWKADVVFNNLIARGEMPVTIGVFVTPGVAKARDGATALDRFNRSFEYDSLGDGYARFILEEIFPEVEKRTTTDGRAIRLSTSGNDRAIGGSSSGGICAFTAAWERPDAFTRVFSAIGTYVGLRGGDRYPTLIRKTAPKPLRVFLQDGSQDNNIYAGSWWLANQAMDSALAFAGYEHTHVWGEGGHNGKHGMAVFPDAMRFLWKGWPEPVKTTPAAPLFGELLLPGEDWRVVWDGMKTPAGAVESAKFFTEGAAVNARGEVFFNDIPNSKTYRVALDGQVSEFLSETKQANGQEFSPAGRLVQVVGGSSQVVSFDASGKNPQILAEGLKGNDLAILHDGSIYVTEPVPDSPKLSGVWLLRPDGTKEQVDTGLRYPNGIVVSPDQSLLYVAESRSHWVYCYRIQANGSLSDKQRYDHLHVPDNAEDSGADGMEVDTAGRLYIATRMGVQICDQTGRVNGILPTPNGKASNLVFGGPAFDILYVTAGDRVYARRLHAKGAPSFAPPLKPSAPKL